MAESADQILLNFEHARIPDESLVRKLAGSEKLIETAMP